MRRARKVDSNQSEIVEALRRAGCRVEVLSDVGRGVPDLLVQCRLRLYLVEVKAPGESLTPAQRDFHDRWNCHIVHTVDEAIQWARWVR